MRSFLLYMAVASLFLTGFKFPLGSIDLYVHYAYMPLVILAAMAVSGTVISGSLVAVLAALLLHTLLATGMFGGGLARPAMQLALIGATLLMFQQVVAIVGYDIYRVMRAYMHLAVAVSAIGLVQVAAFFLDIRPGYDLGWLVPEFSMHINEFGVLRAQSILKEPSHLGHILAPAVFVAVLNLSSRVPVFIGRRASAVIIAITLLSFSTVSYAAIFAAVCLVALNVRRGAAAWVMVCGLTMIVALYFYVPGFKLRADDTFGALMYNDLVSANFSTLTLYNNLRVAITHLVDTGFWGGGLGSHLGAFERDSVLYGLAGLPFQVAYLNAEDANSLLLRILSELGLPGLIALCAFLWFGYVGRRPDAGTGTAADGLWIVSNAAMVLFVVALLRQGHYSNFGMPLFLLLYAYAARFARAAETEGARGLPGPLDPGFGGPPPLPGAREWSRANGAAPGTGV
ncbi:hypothetical protein ABIE65_002584 [Constrictibacter sp. MBR-5]|jgi:hypothetical protein|uniref:hypothetical protein n=1 Tax=Constrictibacter sp. MBR-5 TaxID=3156467 RepID=UPI003392C53C